ncbi:hypothetical protein ACFO0S_05965 [Chryseomicrobium palamuruense]|uniref:Uncharacterized protein n=1 Tax=Chryseomicrobium palamuruense TaxID=682973 RepID=A0ABV8UV57_9BACL
MELAIYSKETDEPVKLEDESFLAEPLSILKTQIENYLYVSKPHYADWKVEGYVLELDDIFRFYNLLVGLYIPKSKLAAVDEVLQSMWTNPDFNYALTYEANEGIAELNIPINYVKNFNEHATIGETILFSENILKRISERTA